MPRAGWDEPATASVPDAPDGVTLREHVAERLDDGASARDLGRLLGVHETTVHSQTRELRRVSWRRIALPIVAQPEPEPEPEPDADRPARQPAPRPCRRLQARACGHYCTYQGQSVRPAIGCVDCRQYAAPKRTAELLDDLAEAADEMVPGEVGGRSA